MRWGLFIVLALFVSQVFAGCQNDQKPVGGTVTNFAVPSGAVAATKSLFPEGKHPIGATYDQDVAIQFTSAGTMSITFMWEGAGYHNVFGYFMYDPQTQSIKSDPGFVTIFQDVTWTSEGGCMDTGVTVNVSRQFKAGDIVGFWILADGYGKSVNRVPRYFSIHGKTNVNNPDGYRHTVWTQLKDYNNIVLIGFEDLSLGDADYNDVMFYLTINGTYNNGDIPTYSNGTLETCEPSEIVSYNEVKCTQYALLTARNPLACQAYISVAAGWQLAPDNQASKDAIASFGPDAGCIVLASGRGYDYTGATCATNALKTGNFSTSCYTVGCEMSILVIGQTVKDCTGIPNTACNPNVNANVVNKLPSQYTEGVPINPTSVGLFLNKKAGTSAQQQLDFIVGVPDKTKVEIQFLVDFNGLSSTNYNKLKNGLTSLYNLLGAENILPSLGWSTADPSGQLQIRPVTPNVDTLLGQYTAAAAGVTGTTNPSSKVWNNFAQLANSAASGWSKGSAYRFVVILSLADQNGDGLANALAAHTNKMIVPIVLNGNLNSYTLTDFKWSASKLLPSDLTNWATTLINVVVPMARTLRFTPVNDVAGFVKSLPSDTTASTGQNPASITVRYPTSGTSGLTFPYLLKVILWGYDTININIIINHDPVVLLPLSGQAAWNETSSWVVKASDEDGNTLSITYSSVSPSSAGSLIKSKGVAFTAGNLPITGSSDFTGSFSPNGWSNGAITLSGSVSDGCSSTPFQFTFTATAKPNFPPNSNDIQYTTDEDVAINTAIPRLGDQEDPESALVARISLVDGQGTFYTDNTKTTALSVGMFFNTTASRAAIFYVPPPNAYSDGGAPLARFRFFALDTLGLNSADYTVSVVVTPVNDPPVYTGDTVITIDEDTRAEIGLRDYIEDIDTDPSLIRVIIGTNVQRGNLYECVSSETGCTLKPITTVPYTLDLTTNPSGRVIFVPLPNENGDNYANFHLIADDRTNTSVYTITINVRPVNDPPVIIPFFSVLPTWNEMDEDTEYVLSWNVTDIDSPLDSLTVDSRAFPKVFAGKLYQYVPDGNGGYTRGDELSGSDKIPRVSPGKWSVIVVPNPNIYDNSFLRLRLTAYDDYQAPSLPVNAPVRVLPINDPPIIAATEQTLTRTDNLQITLGFISVSDIDAGRKNVDVSFTVQDSSVGHFSFDSLTSREASTNPCKMNADNTSVTCTNDLTSLNEKWFKLIIYYPGTSGSQVITVYANDLGHTDKWDRPLNDTKLVVVNVGEDTGLLNTPGTDNTLTIAVAVSVAGAVGAVALVLFLVRDKLAGQTDAYFESLTEPLSTGGVNPVYQQAGSSGQNPTYVPRV